MNLSIYCQFKIDILYYTKLEYRATYNVTKKAVEKG